jgi:hypothetical protein
MEDPVGPDNDKYLRGLASDIVVVCAWGDIQRWAMSRLEAVKPILAGRQLHCLGVTRRGHPRHPSRLPYSNPLMEFTL